MVRSTLNVLNVSFFTLLQAAKYFQKPDHFVAFLPIVHNKMTECSIMVFHPRTFKFVLPVHRKKLKMHFQVSDFEMVFKSLSFTTV